MARQTSPDSAPARRPFRWGFAGAALAVLVLMVVGQAVGVLLADYPPQRLAAAVALGQWGAAGAELSGLPGSLAARDWLFTAFLVSAVAYLWLQRAAVKRFFRSMEVGVALVVWSTVAVTAGVLVPQMDGFEDPAQRITAENYEQQYKQFRWAQGYFLYHLSHPFGAGLPTAELPPPMRDGLDRFGARYGEEERSNREKRMVAALSGQEKTRAIGEFVERHDAALREYFDVATTLHLNRTYKSNWFATLMGLLAVGVLLNTFKGSPSRWISIHKVGFVVTHLGMALLLVGGCRSKLGTDRGILHLDLRDAPQDEYFQHSRLDRKMRMPFHVKLDRFARRDWKQVEVHFPDEHFTSAPPSYTLWKDRVIDLDFRPDAQGVPRPTLQLRVVDVHERALVDVPIIREELDPESPRPERELFPVAEMQVPDADFDAPPAAPGGPTRRAHMAPGGRNQLYFDPALRFRLRVLHGELPLDVFPADDRALGTLELQVASQGELEPEVVEFGLGDSFELPGGFRVTVKRATANFGLDPNTRQEIRDPRPLAQQPPAAPALWVTIETDSGEPPEERFLLDGVDWRDYGFHERFPLSDVVLRFRWNSWTAPGPKRYALHWAVGQSPVLLDEDGGEAPVVVGEPLPGLDGEVVPLQLVHDAGFEPSIEFPPPRIDDDTGFDADFYSTDPVGVTLEVVRDPGTPGETRETVRLVTYDLHDTWVADDGGVALRFFENDKMLPYEWRSVLSIWEPGPTGELVQVPVGREKDREIRVNDYLYYRGYRFFQTNANPEFPTYSGIGVVYDPGIPWVLAGMWIVIAGATLAFVVKPIGLALRQGRDA